MAREPMSDLAKQIMDITVELYNDQTGENYTWEELDPTKEDINEDTA